MHQSVAILQLPYVYLQIALENEPEQADRFRVDRRSAVSSTALINFLNVPSWSDGVVLFLRSLTAFHMLTHRHDFAMLPMQFEQHDAERSVGTVLWPLALSACCSLVTCTHEDLEEHYLCLLVHGQSAVSSLHCTIL